MIKKLVAAGLVFGALSGQAAATTLSTDLTVDNSFQLFISIDDSLAGTPVGSGTDWTVTYSFSGTALTPGVTNYIHVLAHDDAPPSAFIGDFTLSDANFQFDNGSQFLVADTAHWRASAIGVGSAYVTPARFGPNGTFTWGDRPSIDASAQFIWDSASTCGSCDRYFSTA